MTQLRQTAQPSLQLCGCRWTLPAVDGRQTNHQGLIPEEAWGSGVGMLSVATNCTRPTMAEQSSLVVPPPPCRNVQDQADCASCISICVASLPASLTGLLFLCIPSVSLSCKVASQHPGTPWTKASSLGVALFCYLEVFFPGIRQDSLLSQWSAKGRTRFL